VNKWKRRYRELQVSQERDRALSPVRFRILTIGFEGKTVTLGGAMFTADQPYVSIPILTTDRVLITDGMREVYPDMGYPQGIEP
jgi:hypothetical protein